MCDKYLFHFPSVDFVFWSVVVPVKFFVVYVSKLLYISVSIKFVVANVYNAFHSLKI